MTNLRFYLKNVATIVACFAVCFMFAGCDPVEDDVPQEFTVTFNSNEGSDVQPQTVEDGQKATQPPPPTREGYTFDAWYKEADFVNVWNFDTDVVTADVTLYAKWDVDNTPQALTITVTVEGGSDLDLDAKIDEVRVFAIDNEYDYVLIATGAFVNGGFVVTLPADLDDRFLGELFEDGIPEGIEVSDPSVKISKDVRFIAYKDGEEVGRFYFGTDGLMSMINYANGHVDISGIDENWGSIDTYTDFSLKPGWNFLYGACLDDPITYSETCTLTTIAPTSDAKWFFEEHIDYYALGMQAGMEMCECYQLEDKDDISDCEMEVDMKYWEYQSDMGFMYGYQEAVNDCY